MSERSIGRPARRPPPPVALARPGDVDPDEPGGDRLTPAAGRATLETAWSVTIPLSSRGYLVGAATFLALGVAAPLLWLLSDLPTPALAHLLDRVGRVTAVVPVVGIAMSLAGYNAARVIRRKRRILPRWHALPAVAGFDDRLRLERYRGRCPLCGGSLKSYNKPTRWIQELDEGGPRSVIAERQSAAECRREGNHWWAISRTT